VGHTYFLESIDEQVIVGPVYEVSLRIQGQVMVPERKVMCKGERGEGE